jgi:iron complex outermembrane receptor protein
MKTIGLVSLAIVVGAGQAQAQIEQKDTLEYRYPTEVVVTASRMTIPLKEIPFSTSIVGREIIRELPRSIAVDEALKLVPGVKIDNQANGSRVHLSIRGQGILTERGIRGIKLLLDGIPMNDPTGFAPDFFDVDYNTVDRIEVLRGPATSIYGGSASGGIIHILTQHSPNAPLFGEASGTVGSNNFWKGFGQFGGNLNTINYRVSFSRTMGDGYRDHTHFWGSNAYVKATYTPSSSLQLTPLLSWTDFYHENPEGINLLQYRQNARQANPDAIPFNEYLETNRVTYGLTGSIRFNDSHEVQFNGYVKRSLFTEANNRTFTHRTIMTPGASLQYSLRSGEAENFIRNTVSIGTDVQWQTIDEHRLDNLHAVEGDTIRSKEQIKQSGVGLFIIDKLSIGKNWGVMACLRYDNIQNELDDLLRNPYDLSGDADFSKTTGRIGLTFSPHEDLTLYGSWGQGFLPPATEELAQNPDHFGGFNTHLTYATSNSYELGSRGSLDNLLQYEITGFYLTTGNDFDRYRIPDPLRNQETFYRNVGSSRRFGLELYTKYSPIQSVDLQAAYTYSDFRYTNSSPVRIMMDDPAILKFIVDGRLLPNSPQHQLAVDVRYDLTPGLSIGLSTETLSKAHIDGANIESEAAEGYTLLHGRIRYTWYAAGFGGEFSVHVRNIADKEYVAFTEPDPGGNSYQPGARREIFCGLRIRL